jgi:hypothetical protein
VEKLEDRLTPQNGLSPSQAFVSSAYQVILNRPADAVGLAAWSAALDTHSLNLLQVAQGLVYSPEHHAAAVQTIYQTFLHRQPEAAALANNINFLSAGGTLKSVKEAVLSSAEFFQDAGGTNAAFVQVLFNELLGRAPEPVTQEAFTHALDAGVARLDIVKTVLNSPEGESDEHANLTRNVVQRTADPANANVLVAALAETEEEDFVSASAERSLASNLEELGEHEAILTLPAGTTINQGVTVPSGAMAISLSGVTLPAGAVAVLLPGQMLPAGATVLTDVTAPAGAATITIPGVNLPTGTVAVPINGAVLPGGIIVGSTNGGESGDHESDSGDENHSTGDENHNNGDENHNNNDQGDESSASGERNVVVTGAIVSLPAGTTITRGVTVPEGGQAISIPGVTLPSGAVAVLLPGQALPAGATVVSGVTIPEDAITVTIPGVMLPTGVVAVPIRGAVVA